jgi:hypothetical protein
VEIRVFGIDDPHELALVHHGDAIRQGENLLELGRNEQHRRAFVARGDDLLGVGQVLGPALGGVGIVQRRVGLHVGEELPLVVAGPAPPEAPAEPEAPIAADTAPDPAAATGPGAPTPPVPPTPWNQGASPPSGARERRERDPLLAIIGGLALVALGAFFLVRDRIAIDWGIVWAAGLVAVGVVVIVAALRPRR